MCIATSTRVLYACTYFPRVCFHKCSSTRRVHYMPRVNVVHVTWKECSFLMVSREIMCVKMKLYLSGTVYITHTILFDVYLDPTKCTSGA